MEEGWLAVPLCYRHRTFVNSLLNRWQKLNMYRTLLRTSIFIPATSRPQICSSPPGKNFWLRRCVRSASAMLHRHRTLPTPVDHRDLNFFTARQQIGCKAPLPRNDLSRVEWPVRTSTQSLDQPGPKWHQLLKPLNGVARLFRARQRTKRLFSDDVYYTHSLTTLLDSKLSLCVFLDSRA